MGGTWATSHPEQVEAIVPIAIAIAGAVGAFLPDKHQEEKQNGQRSQTDPTNDATSNEEEKDNIHQEPEGTINYETGDIRGGFKDSYGDK